MLIPQINVQPKKHKTLFEPKKFKSTEELFPNWITAFPMLQDFANKTKGLKVTWPMTIHDHTSIDISMVYPEVRDEISGAMIPTYMTFPEEMRPILYGILSTLTADYIPYVEGYLNEKATQQTISNLESSIVEYQQYILSCGGRDILYELQFRLGLRI